MKQLLQEARNGQIWVADVPAPQLLPGCLLVRVAASLVSAGTERASSEFSRKNLFQKAKARPDLVREVITKARRDGILSTISAVSSRLDQPASVGYSSAGTIIGVGEGVKDLSVGDHVACSGAGYASHAEVVCVPRLLVARVPLQSNISPEEASFATVGAVAMHGVRTAEVQLGDVVAVIGLGLLGQLTVQLLKTAGCFVIGLDINEQRAHLAGCLGADAVCCSADTFRDLCRSHTSGYGADAVIITAETSSSEPVNLAGEVARDRAIITTVGTVGMEIDRKIYYAKELDLRISRSYGPGRYDASYEQKGRDYPIGYVRWTETRNMEAFIRLLADGKLNLQPLITHRFPIRQAAGAYSLISGARSEPFLGIVITYPSSDSALKNLQLVTNQPISRRTGQPISLGILGAGAFATSVLLPAIKRQQNVCFAGVCTANGSRSLYAAKKFGFDYCTTDEQKVFFDDSINTVVIATRHHLHAAQVLSALRAGKHVFCEKPLCLNETELAAIIETYDSMKQRPLLLVGFNRRFAPMAMQMKAFLAETREPLAMHYRVNAGSLSPDHWVNDPEQGGGRLLGEVCHFIDSLSFLAGAAPIEVQAQDVTSLHDYSSDNVILSLKFANGSHGTISYLTNGDRAYSKERIEVFSGGCAAVLDDFRRLELVRHGRKQIFRSHFRQDKGHRAEMEAFFSAIERGNPSPIPFQEIVTTTLATLRAAESRASGKSTMIDPDSCFAINLRNA